MIKGFIFKYIIRPIFLCDISNICDVFSFLHKTHTYNFYINKTDNDLTTSIPKKSIIFKDINDVKTRYMSVLKNIELCENIIDSNYKCLKIISEYQFNNIEKNPLYINGEEFRKYKITKCKNTYTINHKIIPTGYIKGDPPNFILFSNRKIDSTEIFNNIIIQCDNNNHICSVKLDKSHPNADRDNHFCLDNLLYSEFAESNISRLINNIKVFNLNSCYFIPRYLE